MSTEVITLREADGAVIAEFHTHEVDMFNVPDLRAAFGECLEKRPDVIILDLGETAYMDSSALGYLFSLYKQVNAYGGRFALVRVQKRIEQLLTINGARKYFELYETVQQAADGI